MATIGNHLKIQVPLSSRGKAIEFYRDILGASELSGPTDNIRVFRLSDGFILGLFFVSDSEALAGELFQKATWLELMTDDVDSLRGRVRSADLSEIEYPDKEHFYFQAPGGQVFRIASNSER